jgi:hypothetical protein
MVKYNENAPHSGAFSRAKKWVGKKSAGRRGEDTKRNLKHVRYLFSLVKARRKLLT